MSSANDKNASTNPAIVRPRFSDFPADLRLMFIAAVIGGIALISLGVMLQLKFGA